MLPFLVHLCYGSVTYDLARLSLVCFLPLCCLQPVAVYPHCTRCGVKTSRESALRHASLQSLKKALPHSTSLLWLLSCPVIQKKAFKYLVWALCGLPVCLELGITTESRVGKILVLCGSTHRRPQDQSVGKSPIASVIYRCVLVLSVKS